MRLSQSSLALGLVVIGAGGYAYLHDAPADDVSRPYAPAPAEPQGDPGMEGEDPSQEQEMDPEPDNEPAAVEWTVPATWKQAPNPSSMRLATYAVPHAPGDSADADLSVSRAGGDVEANIDRWAGQFQDNPQPKRRMLDVRGLRVILVDLEGTYASGMGGATAPQPGWALTAAIVLTAGQPYFFKMTGPAATVRAAAPAFLGMIQGLRRPGEIVDAGTKG